jgi:hypothetical protein
MTKDEVIEYINNKPAYDLMYGLVHYRSAPNHDNSIALKLIECYKTLLHLEGSRVVVPECFSCNSGQHPIAELYVYATRNNLFRKSEVVEVKKKRK